MGFKGLRSLKKKPGINNTIFTIKSDGERKKKGQRNKTKTKQNKKREQRQKICFIPFVRLFLSKFVETETTEVEGLELYFPHQMQQTPLTKQLSKASSL